MSTGAVQLLRRLQAVHLVPAGLHAGALAASWCAFAAGGPWLVLLPVSWALTVFCNHAALARLHEAIHGTLCRGSHTVNEAVGILIGTCAWTPMTVYRDVHLRHHAHLATRADPELVPYSDPCAGRAVRCATAAAELIGGVVVTPGLYTWRTLRAWARHPGRLRGRLVGELALVTVVWGGVVVLAAGSGALGTLGVVWFVPAWATGMFQTARKFAEHMGLRGDTAASSTRTVAPATSSGVARWASWVHLHADFHGTHHQWPGIGWEELPRETARRAGRLRIYADHWTPMREGLAGLADPRAGEGFGGPRLESRPPGAINGA